MKFHLSIDDVIYSLMDICLEKPASVFDNQFFRFLKNMNQKYGAVFTLYAFGNYAETFFINDIPMIYWNELCDCKFIKIGFHGVFQKNMNCLFGEKCEKFYSCIPSGLWASTVRLHRYEADTTMIELLHKYGMTIMLCREDESRKKQNFPPSYIFSKSEENGINILPVKIKDTLYVKTMFRIEFHEKNELIQEIQAVSNQNNCSCIISIFTHERFLFDYSDHIEAICNFIHNKHKADFVF